MPLLLTASVPGLGRIRAALARSVAGMLGLLALAPCSVSLGDTGVVPRLMSVEQLQQFLKSEHADVLVLFTSTDRGCGPCVSSIQGAPAVVSESRWSHPFVEVSWTPWTELPASLKNLPLADSILAVPTLIRFHAGREVDRVVGWPVRDAQKMRSLLQDGSR